MMWRCLSLAGSGLFYSQIHIDRRNIPYIVGVKKIDLSQNLNLGYDGA